MVTPFRITTGHEVPGDVTMPLLCAEARQLSASTPR